MNNNSVHGRVGRRKPTQTCSTEHRWCCKTMTKSSYSRTNAMKWLRPHKLSDRTVYKLLKGEKIHDLKWWLKRKPHDKRLEYCATVQLWRRWGGQKEVTMERKKRWEIRRKNRWRKGWWQKQGHGGGWRARMGVKGVTHSCPHHQRPVLIYPEQSIRSGGRHW